MCSTSVPNRRGLIGVVTKLGSSSQVSGRHIPSFPLRALPAPPSMIRWIVSRSVPVRPGGRRLVQSVGWAAGTACLFSTLPAGARPSTLTRQGGKGECARSLRRKASSFEPTMDVTHVWWDVMFRKSAVSSKPTSPSLATPGPHSLCGFRGSRNFRRRTEREDSW
jgi:hypothetical protein